MELGLKGKKALVMASSKGLGRSVALELALEGAEVMINGRNEDDLLKTAEEIAGLSEGKIHCTVGDVSSRTDRINILSEVKSKMGAIDILITNSGGPPLGNFESHDESDWERISVIAGKYCSYD